MTIRKVNFELKFKAQAWWITSPEIPGLLATSGTIPDALEQAATVIRDMALAFAHAAADGLEPKPIFREPLRDNGQPTSPKED